MIIHQIHDLILEDRQISANSIAQQLGISRERVGSSFMEIWTCGSSLCNGFWNAWTWIKNVNSANRLSKIWNFFSAIEMISCRDWWSWTKPGCITMTWRYSNNQWGGSIAAHPTPENSKCKNPLEKFSPLFLGIRTASSSLIISTKGPNYQRRVLLISAWCLDHPPYSLDLALSDYHLFPGLKKQLKGHHFLSNIEVIAATETWLDGKPSEFFLNGL